MKYHLSSEQSMKNIIHNMREIDKHLKFKREIGEAYDERYMQLSRLREEMCRQLGDWYYVQQNVKDQWNWK